MAVDASPRPMRLAIVASRLPLPMTRADQITVAHWIAFLAARGHAIELFALTEDSAARPKEMAWLHRHCTAVHLFPRSRWRSVLGAVAGWLRGRPLQVGYFDDRAQAKAIQSAAKRFDAVYVYYIRSAQTVGRTFDAPAILGMQLSQTLNIARMLESFRPGWERWLYRLEAPLIRRYEAQAWQRFARTVLIGPADLAAVQEACATERQPQIDNAVLAPHGITLGPKPPMDRDDGHTVMFLGVLATNTNVEAVLWFVSEIWPRVRQARPAARFRIAGRRPRKTIQALHGREGIEVLGEIGDPLPYLAEASVCVSPVRAAAGMQNKLLDYFRAGKAVVATPAANEGIGAPPARAVRLADTPEAFARELIDLLESREERLRLGRAARAFVEKGWSWEAWFLKLEQVIETAVRYPRPAVQSSQHELRPRPAQGEYVSVAEAETPWGER